MRIIHHVSGGIHTHARAYGVFKDKGIPMKKASNVFFFEMGEDDPLWEIVRSVLDEANRTTLPRVEFDEAELAGASHLQIDADWLHGYPQPEFDFAYTKATYDPDTYCMECDTGKNQIAPFRMRREPRWGRRAVMRLNWVRSEVFVTREVYEAFFSPYGIECWPVLKRGGTEMLTVVQLRVDTVARGPAKHLDGFKALVCPVCGRTKYEGYLLDYLPRPAVLPDAPAFRLPEEYGSGGESGRPIVVSQEIRRRLLGAQIRGVKFHPVLPEGEDRPLRVDY